jgi:polyhydroxyalkanoate depolymerase
MAIVEQKCAEDIPLTINGKRHYEDFDSQVQQYVEILKHLKELTGFPPHLIAVCQPGPLLMSSLILHPDLGRTFGSAGAPMHTDGERGYLTDFARLVGGDYIDVLTQLLGRTIPAGHVGEGRQYYDGRFQVFGFYFLGIDQHLRNFRRLLSDLKYGDKEDAERQLAFYQWYNHVQHSPLGFIRDTYKKIFVNNELVRGILTIAGRKIGIKDYPPSIPIWALGGTRDDITPPLQATGHMDLIDSVPGENKMTLLCEAGHMGLFRSAKVLEEYYTRIVEFILKHSDRV